MWTVVGIEVETVTIIVEVEVEFWGKKKETEGSWTIIYIGEVRTSKIVSKLDDGETCWRCWMKNVKDKLVRRPKEITK